MTLNLTLPFKTLRELKAGIEVKCEKKEQHLDLVLCSLMSQLRPLQVDPLGISLK